MDILEGRSHRSEGCMELDDQCADDVHHNHRSCCWTWSIHPHSIGALLQLRRSKWAIWQKCDSYLETAQHLEDCQCHTTGTWWESSMPTTWIVCMAKSRAGATGVAWSPCWDSIQGVAARVGCKGPAKRLARTQAAVHLLAVPVLVSPHSWRHQLCDLVLLACHPALRVVDMGIRWRSIPWSHHDIDVPGGAPVHHWCHLEWCLGVHSLQAPDKPCHWRQAWPGTAYQGICLHTQCLQCHMSPPWRSSCLSPHRPGDRPPSCTCQSSACSALHP